MSHGAELIGELEQYEDSYRLCYVRGPEGPLLRGVDKPAGSSGSGLEKDETIRRAAYSRREQQRRAMLSA